MAPKIANGDEAAAIAAAVARFEMEVAGAPEEGPPAPSPWQRTALLEGVGAKQTIQYPETGGARWPS